MRHSLSLASLVSLTFDAVYYTTLNEERVTKSHAPVTSRKPVRLETSGGFRPGKIVTRRTAIGKCAGTVFTPINYTTLYPSL
ncbi:hypothetical protein F5Y08DRAFT_309750 [Xylaria arbuscula]|nr:hypothetical protein F5Y08DRAFT_309750 [Xylaria arbuscula]